MHVLKVHWNISIELNLNTLKSLTFLPTTWRMQSYLKPNQITISEAKLIFLVRPRMLDVKENFKNKYSDSKCPNCTEEDTQSHLLFCDKLISASSIVQVPNYSKHFGEDLNKILKVTRIMSENFKERNKLKKSQDVNHVNRID